MDVHLAVRGVHMIAAVVIGGGAVLLALLCWRPARAGIESILSVARQYELAFWAAFGVVVAAGVGNLGVFGDGLPGPDSEWGTALTWKLTLVLLLAVVSVARTLLVAGLERVEEARALPVLRTAYTATSLIILAAIGLAEVLAHG